MTDALHFPLLFSRDGLDPIAELGERRATEPVSKLELPFGITAWLVTGYDAAKQVLGRKRVALVDAQGIWLAVAVVPANVQDRDCLDALTSGKEAWPSLREAVLDGAFVAERCQQWCNFHGMRYRIVERDPALKGFVVLERRWVVERSFGWLGHWGGLLRDRAGRLDVAAARVTLVAVLSGIAALINPRPVHADTK